MSDWTEKLPAGECPDCGVVADNDVNFNFPSPATCGKCGAKLKVAGMATPDELADYV